MKTYKINYNQGQSELILFQNQIIGTNIEYISDYKINLIIYMKDEEVLTLPISINEINSIKEQLNKINKELKFISFYRFAISKEYLTGINKTSNSIKIFFNKTLVNFDINKDSEKEYKNFLKNILKD